MATHGRGEQSASLIPTAHTAAIHLTSNVSASVIAQFPSQVITTFTELFGADLRQWRFIVDLFCETVGQDSANLASAIRSGEDIQIAGATHRIAGSARILGYQAIGNAARRIERAAQSIGPHQQRVEDTQPVLTCPRALASESRQQASGCLWLGTVVASWPSATLRRTSLK